MCDASAKSEIGFSLNDCLEKGQPLQYKLRNVLVRSRFHSVTLCVDIEKAFLQIRIRESGEIVLDFIGLKLLIMIKLRSIILLDLCLDLPSHFRGNFGCLF